jgi:hypothetical protein
MSIINQYGRLYKKNEDDEYMRIDGIPTLNPELNVDTRFALTVNGKIFDTKKVVEIQCSDDPEESYLQCVEDEPKLWLLRNDKVLITYDLQDYSIAEVESEVEQLGSDVLGYPYYVKNNSIVIPPTDVNEYDQDKVIEIESPIIGYWNGMVVTEAGLLVLNSFHMDRIVNTLPLLGDWNDHVEGNGRYKLLNCALIPIPYEQLDHIEYLTLKCIIFENVEGELNIRTMVVEDHGMGVNGRIEVIHSKMLQDLHRSSPFIGGVNYGDMYINSAYIYNDVGLIMSSYDMGEFVEYQTPINLNGEIPEFIFKSHKIIKSTRSIIQ